MAKVASATVPTAPDGTYPAVLQFTVAPLTLKTAAAILPTCLEVANLLLLLSPPAYQPAVPIFIVAASVPEILVVVIDGVAALLIGIYLVAAAALPAVIL